jgi:hypothetical protein
MVVKKPAHCRFVELFNGQVRLTCPPRKVRDAVKISPGSGLGISALLQIVDEGINIGCEIAFKKTIIGSGVK